jgi:acyl-CoA reductase-like NAD-dependent aldehyde dehydrogenase
LYNRTNASAPGNTGGYKYSGIGAEGVLSTFDEVTRTKTIVLKNII